MRLDQLGLTPTGKKATRKLGGQVHKTTVAAAMEPKLKLGVVGIEIGQEQSKGATSIVESVGDDIVALMIKAAKTLKYRRKLPGADKRDAWYAAIQIGRLYDDQVSEKANKAVELMGTLVKMTRENVNTKYAQELLDLGVTAGAIGKVATAVSVLPSLNDDLQEQVVDVDVILGFIDHITGYIEDDEADPLDRKMAIAVCKKAGFAV